MATSGKLRIRPRLDLTLLVLSGIAFPVLAILLYDRLSLFTLALPAVLLVAWLAMFRIKALFRIVVFFTPLSLNLEDIAGGIGFYLPTEPLLFGMLLVISLQALYRPLVTREVVSHPISMMVIAYMTWLVFTTVTSELPVVSLKFILSKLWFIVPILWFGAQLFYEEPLRVKRFTWTYILPLAMVVAYTVVHHAMYRFEEAPAHWVMAPFFKDHTSYGAILAMVIPISVLYVMRSKRGSIERMAAWAILVILMAGVLFSYTRAAWVSLLAALALLVAIKLRIHAWIIVLISLIAVVVLAVSWEGLMIEMSKNRTDSSDDLGKHVESISNISTDASNLERINRWTSAYDMWVDRPVVGHGPGTYAMLYAPYQRPENKTIISTNAGTMGNAHSEYLGSLAETGLPGMIFFIALIAVVFWRASVCWRTMPHGFERDMLLAMVLGLVTYWVHAFLNNYLDTDKASILVWGFSAYILAMDLRNTRRLKGIGRG